MTKISKTQKEKMIKELIKAGATRRNPREPYTDGSLGGKGKPILEIKI